MENPPTKAIYTELHEGVSGATFTLQDTEEAAQRSRVHPEHLAGRGEPTRGAGTERGWSSALKGLELNSASAQMGVIQTASFYPE